MRWRVLVSVWLLAAVLAGPAALADATGTIEPPRKLTEAQAAQAAANYQRYCSLCHGADRQGYVNDHAPSLRSRSLMRTGVPHEVLRALSYGREGTAMGGYLDEAGGPLTLDETWDLTYWLFWQSGATDRLDIGTEMIEGDAAHGERLFRENCTSCHGNEGEGVTAPAIANRSMLAHSSDEFIRYAIANGREDTPMAGWKGILSEQDINDLTAFLRSRAEGWTATKTVLQPLPTPDQYVLNKEGEDPDFQLRDGMHVSAKDLHEALQAGKRMVLLDTRVTSVWQRVHIAGSIPLPYYTKLDDVVADLPKDVQIVAYCSCPRAAADYVVEQLRERGFSRTAVMYEGIFGWMNLGYPVARGQVSPP